MENNINENEINNLSPEIQNILNETNTNSTNYINTTIQDTNIITLDTIHNDLGIITSFLIIASVLIFMYIIYRLFKMFF